MALGHTLLTIAYYVLKRGTCYVELGAEFWDRLDPDRTARGLVKRLDRSSRREEWEYL
ncbi:MAG: hypothetical protein JOZ53_24210 [Planctomycetaceae bacterium]|nr:hypothetical protein [Planctomycetaceae bacterium]